MTLSTHYTHHLLVAPLWAPHNSLEVFSSLGLCDRDKFNYSTFRGLWLPRSRTLREQNAAYGYASMHRCERRRLAISRQIFNSLSP